MRAVLIVMALMAWVYCVIGAVGLTAYLAAVAGGALRARYVGAERTPPPPARGVVTALVVFAVTMVAMASGLAAVALSDEPSALSSAAAWAALPSWSALAAASTAVVLWRRRPTAAA